MRAIRADLLDFCATPPWGDVQADAPGPGCSPSGTTPSVRWRPGHWLLIDERGRIAGAQAQEPAPGIAREDWRGHLLLPGFIDTHVHSAQAAVVASYGKDLLQWLNDYTFPAELEQAQPEVARRTASAFVQALHANGTTSAVVMPTVHATSAHALFEAAAQTGMRLVTGKVLMDRHAPEGLLDDADAHTARRLCEQQIERWHGQGRASYAVTVRFAPTSTPAQLAMAGALAASDASLFMQTHVAETLAECEWVRQLFPKARSYLDVYAQAGLLHKRAVLAHGIWLDGHEHATVRATGAQIAHCPSSNLFLGSGLFDWQSAAAAGLPISLASDVGGGPQLNLLRVMAEAYRVSAMLGHEELGRAARAALRPSPSRLANIQRSPLTAFTALHAATLGAAQALGLAHEIGSFEPGTVADLTLWRWSANPLQQARQARASSLHERLFAWMLQGDEHQLLRTWVAGRCVFKQGPSIAPEHA